MSKYFNARCTTQFINCLEAGTTSPILCLKNMKKEKKDGFCDFSPLVEGKTKANVKKNNGEGRKAPPPPPINKP